MKDNRDEYRRLTKELHHCSQRFAIESFVLKIIANRILRSKNDLPAEYIITARHLYLSLSKHFLSLSLARKMPLMWRYMVKRLEVLGSQVIAPHDSDAQPSVLSVIAAAPKLPPPPPTHAAVSSPKQSPSTPPSSATNSNPNTNNMTVPAYPPYIHYQYQQRIQTQQQYPNQVHQHQHQHQPQIGDSQINQNLHPFVISERYVPANNTDTSAQTSSVPSNQSHTSSSPSPSPSPATTPSSPQTTNEATAQYLQKRPPPPASMPAPTAAPSAASSASVSSSYRHNETKSWETDRRRLFTAFRALTVLENGEADDYFELVRRWAEMQTELSDNEETVLSRQFGAPRVPHIHPDVSDGHIRILVDAVQQSLERKDRNIFAIQLLQALVCIRFPESVDRLLDSVLASCHHGACAVDNWDRGFTETLPIGDAGPKDVVNWLLVLNQHLPLPSRFTPAALRLFEFLVCRPGFETYLSRLDVDSEPVNALRAFLARCLPQPSQGGAVLVSSSWLAEGTAIKDTLGMYHRVLSKVMRGVPLLNEGLWEIYVMSVFPLCMMAPGSECITLTQAFLSSIDWNTVTLHHNPQVLERLWLCLPYNPDIVAYIVSAVNWESVLNVEHEHAVKNLQLLSRLKSKLLKILFDLNLSVPKKLPASLRNILEHAAARKHDTDLQGPYNTLHRGILAEDLAAEFQGEVLFRPLKHYAISHDPGEALMLNSMALVDVVFHIDDPTAAVACAKEIRSLMFVTVSGGTNNHWHLSFDNHSSLLLNAIIPLTRKYGSPPLLECLFTSIESCRLGNPPVRRNGYIGFANSLEPFFDENYIQEIQRNDEGLRSFIDKVYNLVSLFCSRTSDQLCIEMLSSVPSMIENTEILCNVLEEITRQYLKESNAPHPRDTAASSLSLSASLTPFSESFTNLLKCCLSTKSFLFMTIIMQQMLMRTSEHTQPETTDTSFHIQSTIAYIGSFVIHAEPNTSGRDYELLYLYFFFLELLEHRAWNFEDANLNSLYDTFQSALGKIVSKKSFWKKTMKREQRVSPAMILACHAVSIVASRIRQDYFSVDDNQLLRKSGKSDAKKKLDQLLKLREKPTFKEYNEFFDDVTGLISPMADLDILRTLIVEKLFPLCAYINKI